jgi:hypothetical protein
LLDKRIETALLEMLTYQGPVPWTDDPFPIVLTDKQLGHLQWTSVDLPQSSRVRII